MDYVCVGILLFWILKVKATYIPREKLYINSQTILRHFYFDQVSALSPVR